MLTLVHSLAFESVNETVLAAGFWARFRSIIYFG